MEKKRILVVGVIGLLLGAGLFMAGCDEPGDNCKGNGKCTVTIEQGPNGLLIDNDAPRSTCGSNSKWNSELGIWEDGCKVEDTIDNREGNFMKYGTHGCDC